MISYIKASSHVLNSNFGDFESGDMVQVQGVLNGIALCTSFLLEDYQSVMIPEHKLDQMFVVIDEDDDDSPSFVAGVEVEIVTVTDKYRHVISFSNLDDTVFGRGVATCSSDDIFDVRYGKLLSQLRSVVDVIKSVEDTIIKVGVI